MNSAFQKRACDGQVSKGRYDNADRIDLVDQLGGICVGRAAMSFRDRLRSLCVDICYANQLDVRHVGIDSRMETAKVTHTDHTDAQPSCLRWRRCWRLRG